MFKKYIITLLIVALGLTFVHSQDTVTQELYDAYYVLAGSSSYYKKLESVSYFYDEYKTTTNKQVISLILQLLDYQFDKADFNEEDDKMYYDDMIAEKLISILELSKSPYTFDILLDVVTKQNHRKATVKAAWKAIEAIDWSKKTNVIE